MSRFIETIQIKNKSLQKIGFHNLRFNTTREHFYKLSPLRLEEIISIPVNLTDDIYRCRVSYSEEIDNIEFIPYQPKNIRTLKIVECNDVEYSYKYADRSKLNELLEKRDNCDDILIIKNGLITDTSSANVIFFDGEKWVTPSRPLLKGTKRAQLIIGKKVEENEIRVTDFDSYTHFRLINALLDEGPELSIKSIFH